jgi:hypothetical protein
MVRYRIVHLSVLHIMCHMAFGFVLFTNSISLFLSYKKKNKNDGEKIT